MALRLYHLSFPRSFPIGRTRHPMRLSTVVAGSCLPVRTDRRPRHRALERGCG